MSYSSILEQRILSVDREILDKLSVNHDEAGQEGRGKYMLCVSVWGSAVRGLEEALDNQTLNICRKDLFYDSVLVTASGQRQVFGSLIRPIHSNVISKEEGEFLQIWFKYSV